VSFRSLRGGHPPGVNFINICNMKLNTVGNKLMFLKTLFGVIHKDKYRTYFAKAVSYTSKMIMKLTAVVDFLNILHVLLITIVEKANVS
jgi:hypothetical protein